MSFYGYRGGRIDWSEDEALNIISKVKSWWQNEKIVLEQDRSNDSWLSSWQVEDICENAERIPDILGYLLCANPSKILVDECYCLINDLKNFKIDIRKSVPYLLLCEKITFGEAQSCLLQGLKEDRVIVRNSVCAIRHCIALKKVSLLNEDFTILVQALVDKLIYRSGVGLISTMRELALIVFEFSFIISDTQKLSIYSSLSTWEELTRIDQNSFSSLDPLHDSNDVLRTGLAILVTAITSNFQISSELEHVDLKLIIDKLKEDPLPEVRNALSDWSKFEVRDVILNRC